jgi:hypothetical protein
MFTMYLVDKIKLHLKTFDLEDKKLIVQLSYCEPVLSKYIVSKGQSLLQDNFPYFRFYVFQYSCKINANL